MIATSEMLRAARQIERTYCKKRRNTRYIACEDYDFTWSDEEIKRFRQMWRQGISLPNMAVELGRHQNEVAILVIDQEDKGYIRQRPGGVFGTEGECGR